MPATLHPAAVLRARTSEDRERERRNFVDDLLPSSVLSKESSLKNNPFSHRHIHSSLPQFRGRGD